MTYLLCRNRVIDYKKWRVIFDSHHQAQIEAGLKLVHIWSSIEDSNNVFFLFEVKDIDKAKAFLNDPQAAEAGNDSGVIDGDFHFLKNLKLD